MCVTVVWLGGLTERKWRKEESKLKFNHVHTRYQSKIPSQKFLSFCHRNHGGANWVFENGPSKSAGRPRTSVQAWWDAALPVLVLAWWNVRVCLSTLVRLHRHVRFVREKVGNVYILCMLSLPIIIPLQRSRQANALLISINIVLLPCLAELRSINFRCIIFWKLRRPTSKHRCYVTLLLFDINHQVFCYLRRNTRRRWRMNWYACNHLNVIKSRLMVDDQKF